jgi:hypothetical protein
MTANKTANLESKTSNPRKWLSWLSRVAFLCNVLFLVAVILRIFDWLHNEDLTALVVIIGYVLVIIFNPLVNFCYLTLFLLRKKIGVPSWLVTANLIFLILQLIYILYLNDSSYS